MTLRSGAGLRVGLSPMAIKSKFQPKSSGFSVGCLSCSRNGPSHSGWHDQAMPSSTLNSRVNNPSSWSGALAPTPAGGMPRTIQEMISSGRLTQAQINNASLPNVMSMFDAPAAYKAELAHFLQRFILDGYMRGVDVVSKLKAKGQFYIGVQDIQASPIGRPKGIIGTAKSKAIYFDDSYWTANQNYTAKLQTFYHEMAHSVLGQAHKEATSPSGLRNIMSAKGPSGGLGGWAKDYDWMIGQLFNPGNPYKTQGGNLGGMAGPGYSGGFESQAATPVPRPTVPMPTISSPNISMGSGGVSPNLSMQSSVSPTLRIGSGGVGQTLNLGSGGVSPTLSGMAAAPQPSLNPGFSLGGQGIQSSYGGPSGPGIVPTNPSNPIGAPAAMAPNPTEDWIDEPTRSNVFAKALRDLGATALAG